MPPSSDESPEVSDDEPEVSDEMCECSDADEPMCESSDAEVPETELAQLTTPVVSSDDGCSDDPEHAEPEDAQSEDRSDDVPPESDDEMPEWSDMTPVDSDMESDAEPEDSSDDDSSVDPEHAEPEDAQPEDRSDDGSSSSSSSSSSGEHVLFASRYPTSSSKGASAKDLRPKNVSADTSPPNYRITKNRITKQLTRPVEPSSPSPDRDSNRPFETARRFERPVRNNKKTDLRGGGESVLGPHL